jgi:microphthalmia-associated transcription factor
LKLFSPILPIESAHESFPFASARPTFKTITPMSRTQLRQQLQREQLIQEAERKEAERKAQQQQQQQQQKASEQLKVPLQSIDVDVPPQILQVRTKLANPTRYHVIQKQKSQVKQFLSESFKSSESLLPSSVLELSTQPSLASRSQPATACSSPMTKSNTNFRLLSHIQSRNGGLMSQSASDALAQHKQSLEYSSGPTGSNQSLPFLFQSRFGHATASPSEAASAAMSPTLSSVATSVTSASEVSSWFSESRER